MTQNPVIQALFGQFDRDLEMLLRHGFPFGVEVDLRPNTMDVAVQRKMVSYMLQTRYSDIREIKRELAGTSLLLHPPSAASSRSRLSSTMADDPRKQPKPRRRREGRVAKKRPAKTSHSSNSRAKSIWLSVVLPRVKRQKEGVRMKRRLMV